LLQLLTTGSGTQRPCRQSPHMSAIEGRPAVLSRCREFSLRPEPDIDGAEIPQCSGLTPSFRPNCCALLKGQGPRRCHTVS